MNGCCMASCDGRSHDLECRWYWPCGCPKERPAGAKRAKPHVHRYEEPDDNEDLE
jgi:hypothetical protein